MGVLFGLFVAAGYGFLWLAATEGYRKTVVIGLALSALMVVFASFAGSLGCMEHDCSRLNDNEELLYVPVAAGILAVFGAIFTSWLRVSVGVSGAAVVGLLGLFIWGVE